MGLLQKAPVAERSRSAYPETYNSMWVGASATLSDRMLAHPISIICPLTDRPVC